MTPVKMTTEERNKWFKSLPKKEKRVQIAKDVLELLDQKKITTARMSYLTTITNERYTGNLQEFLEKPEVTCQVCAKGALLVARAKGYNSYNPAPRFGNLEVGNFSCYDALEGIFSEVQLDLIECAYEGQTINRFSSQAERAAKKYDHLEKAEDRMRAIMENIIRNNGTFKVVEK